MGLLIVDSGIRSPVTFTQAVVASVLACSCGRIAYDPVATNRFGNVLPIAEVSDPVARDDDPTVTADLLELYFASDRAGGTGGMDIWMSTRREPGDPWQPPTAVAELNSPDMEVTPEVAPDGLTLWIASGRAGGQGDFDIWMATRPSRDDPWSAPVLVPELNSIGYDGSSAPDSELRTILLETLRDDLASVDIYVATRDSEADPWNPPAPLSEVNTDAFEGNPFLTESGLVLYFGSDAAGSRDIYTTVRRSPSEPFGPPSRLVEITSPHTDDDPWLSPDGDLLFFASDRQGTYDIYTASR